MKTQLRFDAVDGWGGKRKGAGKPNRSGLRGHTSRPKIDARKPLHITMKVRKGVASLRSRDFLKQFTFALKRARHFGLNVNQYSVLHDHIHLIVEARGNAELTKGMKSLGGRLGKVIGRLSLGRGSVFKERFHLHVLRSPTEVRNALSYVLLNQARHRKLIDYLDEFSSARYFRDWMALLLGKFAPLLRDEIAGVRNRELPEYLCASRSWLGRTGWHKAL